MNASPRIFTSDLVQRVLVLCWAVLLVSPAAADEPLRVAVLPLVMPSDSGTPQQLHESVQTVSATLAGGSVEVVDPTIVRMRLTAHGRLPSPPLSDAERAEFQRLVRSAWISVGRRDIAQAKLAISQAMAFARDRLEVLNREDQLAETLVNLCLLKPRVMVDEGASRQLVVLEAMECRKLVPRVGPSKNDHVPEVLAAIQEADRIMQSQPPAVLQVSGQAVEECAVFLNGRRVGKVPYRHPTTAGTYLLQVECPVQHELTGLVHDVTLAASKNTTIHIDAFEPYLRESAQGLFLAQDVQGAEHPTKDEILASVSTLAARLGADRVVVVGAPTPGMTRFDVVDVHQGLLRCGAEVSVEALPGNAALLSCAKAEKTVGVAATSVSDSDAEELSQPQPTYVSSRFSSAAGWGIGLAAAGVAVIGGAWITEAATLERDRGSSDHWIQAMGGLGAALVVTSEPLWMPIGKHHAPWWTWAGMAAGVAPVVGSVILWSKDDTCALEFTTGGCATFENTRTPAGLALATSLPLLTLPASFYVARSVWGEARPIVTPTVDARTRSLGMSLRGTF